MEEIPEPEELAHPSRNRRRAALRTRSAIPQSQTVIPALGTQTAATGLMRAQLQALIEAAGKNDARALALLRDAAAADLDQILTHFGPPVPFKPPHELYGEMLLVAKRPAEALTAFQEGLRIYRGRTTTLVGASRAAADVGIAALAKKYAMVLR